MKALFSFLFVALSTVLFAQGDITPKVTDAIRRGDAAALSAYFMDRVEITLPTGEGNYSKEEAKQQLARFFAANTPKEFSVKHQGTSKLDDQYRIGDLVTAKGTFRVTFFMKKSGSGMFIQQFKIEGSGGDF